MKRIVALLTALLFAAAFVSCGNGGPGGKGGGASGGSVRLTFAESINMDRIRELNGRTVEIVGYMATVSPVSGKYIYLMNLPYQSCPYCVPNTQQLSNTIAVYAKEGKKFSFTDGPINVTGTLETGDFSDEYGYTYNYRISGATYTAVNSKEASEKLALWERISSANVASDVYSMFDFIDFECNWPNYTAQFSEGEAYLYPADVDYFEGGQFSTQNDAGFFEGLVSRSKAVKSPVMDELIAIIKDGKALVDKAKSERADKNYTYSAAEDKYTLTNGGALLAEAQDLYSRYALWLENFSLSA